MPVGLRRSRLAGPGGWHALLAIFGPMALGGLLAACSALSLRRLSWARLPCRVAGAMRVLREGLPKAIEELWYEHPRALEILERVSDFLVGRAGERVLVSFPPFTRTRRGVPIFGRIIRRSPGEPRVMVFYSVCRFLPEDSLRSVVLHELAHLEEEAEFTVHWVVDAAADEWPEDLPTLARPVKIFTDMERAKRWLPRRELLPAGSLDEEYEEALRYAVPLGRVLSTCQKGRGRPSLHV